MIEHDGIVGTSGVDPIGTPVEAFDPPKLIRALGPGPRSAVLDFELIEPLTIATEPENAANVDPKGRDWAASVRFQASDELLVRIQRPTTEQLQRQLSLVRGYAELRPDRLPEIHIQIADILSFFGAVDLLDPSRTPWTLELLDAGIRLAVMVEMRIKHALNVPRPVVLSPRIQPIIQTPAHGSLPSGHATEAAIVATLLSHLAAARDAGKRPVPEAEFLTLSKRLTECQHQRYRVAARIAANRTVAGVHYPVDSAAGAILGVTLGEYVAAMATGQACTPSRDFDGGKYAPDASCGGDFHARSLGEILNEGSTDNTGKVLDNPKDNVPLPGHGRHIPALWALAVEEVTAQWPPQPPIEGASNG